MNALCNKINKECFLISKECVLHKDNDAYVYVYVISTPMSELLTLMSMLFLCLCLNYSPRCLCYFYAYVWTTHLDLSVFMYLALPVEWLQKTHTNMYILWRIWKLKILDCWQKSSRISPLFTFLISSVNIWRLYFISAIYSGMLHSSLLLIIKQYRKEWQVYLNTKEFCTLSFVNG